MKHTRVRATRPRIWGTARIRLWPTESWLETWNWDSANWAPVMMGDWVLSSGVSR